MDETKAVELQTALDLLAGVQLCDNTPKEATEARRELEHIIIDLAACYEAHKDDIRAERDAALREVERLRDALDKYADRENWSEDRCDVWIMTPNGYDIARSAKGGDA